MIERDRRAQLRNLFTKILHRIVRCQAPFHPGKIAFHIPCPLQLQVGFGYRDGSFITLVYDQFLIRGIGMTDLYGSFSHHHFEDRKSTRLNSSHVAISYAVFCLKKKNKYTLIMAPWDNSISNPLPRPVE